MCGLLSSEETEAYSTDNLLWPSKGVRHLSLLCSVLIYFLSTTYCISFRQYVHTHICRYVDRCICTVVLYKAYGLDFRYLTEEEKGLWFRSKSSQIIHVFRVVVQCRFFPNQLGSSHVVSTVLSCDATCAFVFACVVLLSCLLVFLSCSVYLLCSCIFCTSCTLCTSCTPCTSCVLRVTFVLVVSHVLCCLPLYSRCSLFFSSTLLLFLKKRTLSHSRFRLRHMKSVL